ncbi:MAG: hypothetical protein ABID45_02720 [Patescibacteria group bacterium]
MKKSTKIILITLILLLIIIMSVTVYYFIYSQKSTECEVDSDCALARTECCAYSRTAMNNDSAENWKNILSKKCGQFSICPEMISQHISLFSNAKCQKGVCIAEPDKDRVCNDSPIYENCKSITKEASLQSYEEGNDVDCEEIIKLCE